MHKTSHLSAVLKEFCLLCDLSHFKVIAVQALSPHIRIPWNNHTSVKRQKRRWLTISEYCNLFDDRADSALSDYSPHITISNLDKRNAKLSERYGDPNEM